MNQKIAVTLFSITLILITAVPGFGALRWLQNEFLNEGDPGYVQQGFEYGEIAAAKLEAPPGEYPLKLKKIRVMYGLLGQLPTNLVVHVWDASGEWPQPGAILIDPFSITNVTPGYFTDIDISPYNITITSGAFIIGMEHLQAYPPGIVCDAGITPEVNSIFGDVAGWAWFKAEYLGVSGDFVIRCQVDNALGETPTPTNTPTNTPTGVLTSTPTATPTPTTEFTFTPTGTPTDTPEPATPTPTAPPVPEMADEPEFTTGLSNTITWTAGISSKGVVYLAECSKFDDFSEIYAQSGWIDDTEYEFTGLEDIEKFYYRVKARDSEGGAESAFSNTVFSTQDASMPQIRLAGYYQTEISSAHGGDLMMFAHVVDNIGVNDVSLYYGSVPLDWELKDDGTQGDWPPDDTVYSWIASGIEPGANPGQYNVELIATDLAGNKSITWPYFEVISGGPPAGKSCKSGMSDFHFVNNEPLWEFLAQALINGRQKNRSSSPQIWFGGFWDSEVYVDTGGEFTIMAVAVDPDGKQDIKSVEVSFADIPTGLYLNDDGISGDDTPGDTLYTIRTVLPPLEEENAGVFPLQFIAEDYEGNKSLAWPYLHIVE